MRWIASFLIIVSVSATAAGKVYKIVHPDGTVEYSSEPAPGAEEIRVPSLPTYEPRVPAAPSPRTRAATEQSEPQQQAAANYQVSITQPSPEETVYFDAAGMSVSASVNPSLQSGAGHTVVFMLDGVERARVAGTATNLEVERGSHTLVARVETEDGQVLATSNPVTFHMRQRSIRQPAPSVRPGGAARTLP
jgi:hypothetical protein